MAILDAVKQVIFERRQRERVDLRCEVQIFADGEPAMRATTLNLSSRGFYCVSERRLAPGDQVQCLIVFTPIGLGSEGALASLSCVAEVVRTDERQDGFGIACRIERYKLVRGSEVEALGTGAQVPGVR